MDVSSNIIWVSRTCEVSWASRFDPLLVKITVLKCFLRGHDSSHSHQVDANPLRSRNDGKHRCTGIAEQGRSATRSSEGRKVGDPNCGFVHFAGAGQNNSTAHDRHVG